MLRLILFCELAGKLAAAGWWMKHPGSPLGFVWFFAPDPLVFYHLFVPFAQGFCRVFTHFETERPEVWLTIDDGPDPKDTPQLLALLARHEARATFFLIGERAARWPELVEQIVRGGHEIAHHTHRHPVGTFWCASPARLRAELDDALAAFAVVGVRPRRFRAPVGIKHILLGRELDARGLACIGWSVRSGDCLGRCAGSIVASVMRRVRPGGIVLVHEGPGVPAALRVRTIERLLEALRARGISCVIPPADRLRA